MGTYREIQGDLIELALAGEFDVITHGCNCFCTMGAGIAVSMKNTFQCDTFKMEDVSQKGNINKLGTIDIEGVTLSRKDGKVEIFNHKKIRRTYKGYEDFAILYVVNSYTQFHYGSNHTDGVSKPFDYEAFTLCMRKINQKFSLERVGLPMIGAGLAGGDWQKIKQIIKQELKDCDITVVIYNK